MDFNIIFDEQKTSLVLAWNNISVPNSTKNERLELIISDCTYSITRLVCTKELEVGWKKPQAFMCCRMSLSKYVFVTAMYFLGNLD